MAVIHQTTFPTCTSAARYGTPTILGEDYCSIN